MLFADVLSAHIHDLGKKDGDRCPAKQISFMGQEHTCPNDFINNTVNEVRDMEEIRPGRYRHFKGGEYRVLFMARHSETEEWMVVYQALYGERGLWVRPASNWCEEVERDGVIRKRFQYLGE